MTKTVIHIITGGHLRETIHSCLFLTHLSKIETFLEVFKILSTCPFRPVFYFKKKQGYKKAHFFLHTRQSFQ